MKLKDRTGVRYGRLVALERMGVNAHKKVMWRCMCDCGVERVVPARSLATGNTTSCGCYLKEVIVKHGGTGKGSYNTWRAMLRRCYNSRDKDYAKYGALGITVYLPWHDYSQFAADVGEPVGEQTLDRIDPFGNYIPENCRWASVATQNRNTRAHKAGTVGVRKLGSKWVARVRIRKDVKSTYCATKEEAILARKALEAEHWR